MHIFNSSLSIYQMQLMVGNGVRVQRKKSTLAASRISCNGRGRCDHNSDGKGEAYCERLNKNFVSDDGEVAGTRTEITEYSKNEKGHLMYTIGKA